MTDDGIPLAPDLAPLHTHASHRRGTGEFTVGQGNAPDVAARLAQPAIVPRAVGDRCPRCGHGAHGARCGAIYNGRACARCGAGNGQPDAKGSEP